MERCVPQWYFRQRSVLQERAVQSSAQRTEGVRQSKLLDRLRDEAHASVHHQGKLMC